MEGMLFVKFSAQPVCPFPFGDGDDDDDSDSRHLLDRHGQRDTVLCNIHAFFSFNFSNNIKSFAMEQ